MRTTPFFLLLAACAGPSTLPVGRIVTVPAENVKNYAVANDNIDVHLSPDGKQFIVVGKKKGRVDLLLIRQDNSKKTITYEVGRE